jgi:hypothetical protein
MRMSTIAVASVVACSVLTAGPLAVADDVNWTGSQTDDSGKSGAATSGGNAIRWAPEIPPQHCR